MVQQFGELQSVYESGLPLERVKLLTRLRREHEIHYEVAWALLEHLEEGEKMSPVDAMGEAIHLAETAADEFRDGQFWSGVYYSLDGIRAEETPDAMLFYSNGGPVGDSECPHALARYTDDTGGDFLTEWVSTDAWRGYAVVRPADGSKWVEVHDDVILTWSEDERMLKDFDDFLREAMDAAGIDYVRAFAPTSNLFSAGYTLFVDKKHAAKVQALVGFIKPIYRDDFRFRVTALTGKDLNACDALDLAFARVGTAILESKSVEPGVLKDRIVSELVQIRFGAERANELAHPIVSGSEQR